MRNLPQVYSQRDPRWAAQRLGTVNGSTIGQYGCYVSSFAMIAGYYGHTITPNALDDIFTNRNIYSDGNLLNDSDLDNVFSDIPFQDHYYYLDKPADLNFLKQLMSDPTLSVILLVDFNHDPKDGFQYHFVVCVDCDGKKVTIADPWYGSIDDFSTHYGNNPAQTILKFVVYKGTPISPTVAVPADVFPQLVDKSTKYDAFHAAGYTTVDDVLKKVGELTNANTQLQQDIQKLQGQIADMATAIQKVKDEDIQAVDESLTAQHERDQAIADLSYAKHLLDLPPQGSRAELEKAIDLLKKQQFTSQPEITDPDVKVAFSLIKFLKKLFGRAGDQV